MGDGGLPGFERVVRAPRLRHDVRGRLAIDEQSRFNSRGVRLMEVPPAVLPNLAAPRAPSLVVAREDELERLGKARLARTVPADDERKSRAGYEVELGRRSDTAESLDLDRVDVGPNRCRDFGRFGGGLGGGFATQAFLDLPEDRREHGSFTPSEIFGSRCSRSRTCEWMDSAMGTLRSLHDIRHVGRLGPAMTVLVTFGRTVFFARL